MNEKLIIKIREEIKRTEETNNYENLYRYAYSNNFIIRYLFMRLLLSNNNLNIEKLYEDNITHYFLKYDDDGNIISIMPYKYVKDLSYKAMIIDTKIYKQILNFIVDTYIISPEKYKKEIDM